ncbi:uncharacterized protein LOC123227872 [Mangifera indica]|uniref:uncharacterized protein LOC123227872 n=1 Tax=Mangifera indica TaxID=29780 RepID=UPI001CF97358|nr:uncharacterized protein LOC123227872 [Mangifera indica]
MSRQIVIRSPSVNRIQSLLRPSRAAPTRSSRFAEMTGGTTAECVAVCCCCPCGIVNLLVLALYKVPARLFKKAIKEKRKKRLIKKGLLPPRKKSKCKCGPEDMELQVYPVQNVSEAINSEDTELELMKLEKEMWERFYSTGFWGSPSQREAFSEMSMV